MAEPTLTEKLFKAKHGRRAEALEEQTKLHEEEIEALRKTLEFKPARMVLVRLLVKAGLLESPFSTNALQMAHGSGYKKFAEELMQEIASVSPKHRNQVIGECYDYTSSSRTGNNAK